MLADSDMKRIASSPLHGASSGKLLPGSALACVALAAAAVIAPMLFRGNASGHDFQFHIASWLEVSRQWHEGVFYPRWAAFANFGHGEPRFIFYPPLSWMAGAALGNVLPRDTRGSCFRRKSLSPAHRLLPQRLRRASRQRALSPVDR